MDPIDSNFYRENQKWLARTQAQEWVRAQRRNQSSIAGLAVLGIFLLLLSRMLNGVFIGLRAISRKSWFALVVLAFTLLAVWACCGGLPH